MMNIREYCGLVGSLSGITGGRLCVVLSLVATLMFPAIAVFASDGQVAMAASGCHEQSAGFQKDLTPDACDGLPCNHTDLACGAAGCLVADFPRASADALPKGFVALRLRAAKTALHIGRPTAPLFRPPNTKISA